MYLSRLLLSGEQLHNPYEIHRTLWAAFPDTPDQARDFLFRVEQSSSRQAQVLMQSQRQPIAEAEHARLLASKLFELNVLEGSQLRFLLIANPVKTIVDEQGRLNSKGEVKKCRVPLINETEQVAWLQRKLADAALVSMVEVEKQLPLHFRKGGKPGKIQPYAFKGVLQVANAQALQDLLQYGIGHAKAFGCGLLSLAR
ncbi:type I-E CRISPR-associated protein Cas6/Cse3/CasE [uncultured Thiothrix sp.]|jgi:CRISPR system Cascade subunit CasE|uniref:type I-E CRISPR-associated protein Cas6/Cse3/CasE n=1 Tax=uncultured Thiothrix sp. TaxID=223185 RepID=UPI00260D6ED8|nr:type I-E CRISPR-associated protein Cas6/Cse3/CasE [uncultured Thiothrix sp.]HMT92541.1 type I-E CRISPR-associated protein Cas6/Cse3/CasE [Thiolinea sp.]